MKIRKKAILMVLVLFCLNFTAFSQNINLNLNNVTVKKAMETLKEENGYSFVFASGDINTQKVIRVKVNNGTIDQVVKQILQDQKVSYEIKNKNIIVQKNEASNQTDNNKKKVTGTVVDVNGLPIIGANIVEKGTTNGIITDMDGNFQLETAGNATLQISYIGYVAQSIPVGKQTNLTITLKEDFQNIDEVVVVGYGSVKKSDLTGSISSISAKDFNKGISRSPDQLLAGKVPGLMVNRSSGDPNSSVTMQLRGPSSLTASTAPFYVIDGIPGASINLVSPDDIESMNVLKDASATAIYGSRAANGVIMVTTRKGRTGKPQVTYSGYAALESVSGRVNVLNADEHRAFLAEHDMSLAASDEGNGAGTDWQKELLRSVGFSHSHNLSLVGGSENTKYNASVNYLSNEGIVKHSNYDRLVARIGVDQDALNNRLHIGLSVSGSFIGSDHVDYSIFNYAARWLPESPVMSDDPANQQYGGYF